MNKQNTLTPIIETQEEQKYKRKGLQKKSSKKAQLSTATKGYQQHLLNKTNRKNGIFRENLEYSHSLK